MGIVTGLVASSAVGAATSYAGAKKQADAAKGAADQSMAMYQQTRSDLLPYQQAGVDALEGLKDYQDFTFKEIPFDLMSDPSYKWRFEQGLEALDRSAASRGRVQSGAQQKAAQRYGQGLASTEYANAWNRNQAENLNAFNRALQTYKTNLGRRYDIANLGENAAAQTGSAGTSAAAQSGSALMNAGNAMAQGMQGIGSSVNTGLNNYLFQQMYSNTPMTPGGMTMNAWNTGNAAGAF